MEKDAIKTSSVQFPLKHSVFHFVYFLVLLFACRACWIKTYEKSNI